MRGSTAQRSELHPRVAESAEGAAGLRRRSQVADSRAAAEVDEAVRTEVAGRAKAGWRTASGFGTAEGTGVMPVRAVGADHATAHARADVLADVLAEGPAAGAGDAEKADTGGSVAAAAETETEARAAVAAFAAVVVAGGSSAERCGHDGQPLSPRS